MGQMSQNLKKKNTGIDTQNKTDELAKLINILDHQSNDEGERENMTDHEYLFHNLTP